MGRPLPRNPDRRSPLQCERLECRLAPSAAPFAAGRVLVNWHAPVAPAEAFRVLGESPLAAGVERIGGGDYAVRLPDGVAVDAVVAAFAKVAGVRAASPDYAITAAATPNDPRAASQWHLRAPSAGQGGTNAYSAWNAGTGTGRTIVAVIDSGTDLSHPDLQPNLWRNPREVAGNGRDDDGNGFVDDVHGVDFTTNSGNPQDGYGHGTHVAGIVGAAGNNGVGVSGMAWRTQIMSLKFMDSAGVGYSSNAIRAIDYAIANGARILNLSWGGGPYNPLLQQALERARNAGAIVVTAAGNGGSNTSSAPFYPAGYAASNASVVSVAATTATDALAGWSNYGSAVTLAAPGESILSTTLGGGYGTKGGTSMAAPVVAGALAALWDSQPGLTAAAVIARLRAGVDALATLAGKVQTAGRLNFAKLMGAPATPPPVVVPPSPPTPTPAGGPRVTAGTFFSGQAGMFDRIRLTFSAPIDLNTFTPADFAVSGPRGVERVSAVLPVAGSNNTQFQVMFNRGLTAAGTYTGVVGPDIRDTAGRLMDQNGNGVGGEASDAFTVTGTRGVAATSPPASPPVSPPPATPSATRSYALTAGGVAMKDWGTTRIEYVINDNFTIGDLDVQLSLSHARTSDLSIVLQGPAGQRVQLFYRRGGSAGLTNTTFDDQAPSAIGAASGSFTGSYRGEQSLSAFTGTNAKGTWVLMIHDLVAGTAGTLGPVALKFAPLNAAASVEAALAAKTTPIRVAV